MILYFYMAVCLSIAKAHQYLHLPSSSYMYSAHGGMNNYVASINEMPYHVLIVYTNSYCSGSLLRSKVVLTAASCFFEWQSQKIVVKVGAETVTGMGQVIEVIDVKKHEYFGHANAIDNDIALLMLKDHVTFGPQVRKIIMIEPEMALQIGTPLDVSGWASPTLEPLKYANSLLWSEMVLLTPDECMRCQPNIMSRSNFCAKYSPERRISDNGGPVVFRELLVGILSFGADSDAEPHVAVLTNVSYFHRWINLNVKRFLKKYCVTPVTLIPGYTIINSDENIDPW